MRMRRLFLTLLLSLNFTFTSFASQEESFSNFLKQYLEKALTLKKIGDPSALFSNLPEDSLFEAYVKAVELDAEMQVSFLDQYQAPVWQKKLPDLFHSIHIAVDLRTSDNVTHARVFDITKGSKDRDQLKQLLKDKKASPAFYWRMYVYHVERAAFLALVKGLYGRQSVLKISVENTLRDYQTRIMELANEAVLVSEKVIDRFLRPVMTKQHPLWDEYAKSKDGPEDFASYQLVPGFQDGDFVGQVDGAWAHIVSNFLVTKHEAIIDLGKAIEDKTRMPELIERLSSLTNQMEKESEKRLVGVLFASPQTRGSDPRIEAKKEKMRKKLVKPEEKKPSAVAPKTEAKKGQSAAVPKSSAKQEPEVRPRSYLKMEDLGIEGLNAIKAGVPLFKQIHDETFDKFFVGQVRFILERYALVKQHFVNAVLGVQGVHVNFEDNNPFVVVLSKRERSFGDLAINLGTPQDASKDGLLLKTWDTQLADRLHEYYVATGKNVTELLYLRDRALCDIFCMRLLIKLIPNMPQMKTAKPERVTHETLVEAYGILFTRLTKCYAPVFAKYLEEIGLRDCGERINDDFLVTGRLSVFLQNFDLSFSIPKDEGIIDRFLEIANTAIQKVTAYDFPAVIHPQLEKRVFEFNGMYETLMEVSAIEYFEDAEKKLKEVNKKLMDKVTFLSGEVLGKDNALKKAEEANAQNKADLKKAEELIEAGRKENADTKKKLEAAFHAAVEETRATCALDKKKMSQAHERQIGKLKQELTSFQSKLEDAERLRDAQLADLAAKSLECASYKQLLDEYKVQLAEAESATHSATALEDLQQKHEALVQEHGVLKQKITEMRGAIDGLNRELELARKGNLTLQTTIESLEQANAGLRRDIETKNSDARMKDNRFQGLQRELEKVQKQAADLSKANIEFAKKNGQLQQRITELKAEVERLEDRRMLDLQNQAIQNASAEALLETELKQSRAQCAELVKGKEVLASQNAELLNEKARLEAEVAALKQAVAARHEVEVPVVDQLAVAKIAKLQKKLEERDLTIASLNLMRKMMESAKAPIDEVEQLKAQIATLEVRLKEQADDLLRRMTWTWTKGDTEEPIAFNAKQMGILVDISLRAGVLEEPGVLEALERLK